MHPYLSAALGGMLIGLASWLLLAGLGRVAGISGITCSALREHGWHAYWRWAFLLGLVMDVADGAVLGQHGVAYVLLAYASANLSRRILWFPLSQQALHVLPLLLLAEAVQMLMRLLAGADFPGWSSFIAPLIATLLWIPATFILLLPQYQPVEQNPDRPI